MLEPETTERAERLRVLLAVAHCSGGSRSETFGAVADLELDDLLILARSDEDDLPLVNACLEVEAELRERAFRRLERLCGLIGEQQGELDERVRSLPEGELEAALLAVVDLGWVD